MGQWAGALSAGRAHARRIDTGTYSGATRRQLPFEAVADQVASELRSATEERALNQYVRILAGDAELEGVDLDDAASPLLQ